MTYLKIKTFKDEIRAINPRVDKEYRVITFEYTNKKGDVSYWSVPFENIEYIKEKPET
jgi:hypothetical protein